jgi:fructokinase
MHAWSVAISTDQDRCTKHRRRIWQRFVYGKKFTHSFIHSQVRRRLAAVPQEGSMVVTFGEALVDLIEQDDGHFAAVLGGSVCNFTLAAARQGMAVTYLNALSSDNFGQRFAQHLRASGVRLASFNRSAKPTSLAVVTLDVRKMPTYAFHRVEVADRDILPEEACAALPAGAALFHTGALALVHDDIASTLQIIKSVARYGALISIDANMRPLVCPELTLYAAGVRMALAEADLIKVSAEDLIHLGFDTIDPVDAARALFDVTLPKLKLVALTLGEGGAVLLSRSSSVRVEIPSSIVVADTVGAGDCFLAGLVASLRRSGILSSEALLDPEEATLQQALDCAVGTASLNLMRAGCNPPTKAELMHFLARPVAA